MFLQILQKLIQNDKDENQGDAHNFLSGPSINVSIRRNYIYEDAYDKLSPENGMQHFMGKKIHLIPLRKLNEPFLASFREEYL